MKISHGTKILTYAEHNGFGYATTQMLNSLEHLGYDVKQNDPTADVEIWFEQAHHVKWSNMDMYKILYLPWESTELLPGWLEVINTADEVWTPSDLIANWFRAVPGWKPPVYVYEHGVDPVWSPKERHVEGRFKFLHMGAEASRKGAKEAMQGLRLAFPKEVDVELNLKMIANSGWNVGILPRINVIDKRMEIIELIELFHSNHAYIYSSAGEGFGLTPLQAMATSMPTLTLPAWAPYRDFLDERLNISSSLTQSPWPRIHPGKMFKPDLDSIIDSMRFVYNNYDDCRRYADSQLENLKAYYDWNRLTSEAFKALENRL